MALDAYALTTLARYKAFVGDTSSTNDTLYEYAINSASARIEKFIGREIMARDRIEFYEPRDADTLRLRQYPLNSCKFIGYGARASLVVSADGAVGDLSHTVSVLETLIRTVRFSAAGASSSNDYDFGSASPAYTMASALQPIIDGATGLVCSLEYNAPLKYLHRLGPIDVTDSPAYLTVPDIRASDFAIDFRTGIVRIGSAYSSYRWPDADDGFGCGTQSVCVDYNAGYSSVPADIEETCWMVATLIFKQRKRDFGISSQSLGDYSYTLADASKVTEIMEEQLGNWREIR